MKKYAHIDEKLLKEFTGKFLDAKLAFYLFLENREGLYLKKFRILDLECFRLINKHKELVEIFYDIAEKYTKEYVFEQAKVKVN